MLSTQSEVSVVKIIDLVQALKKERSRYLPLKAAPNRFRSHA
jgi:hypothetical protein